MRAVAYVEDVDLIPEQARSAGTGVTASAANFGGSTQAIVHLRVSAIDGIPRIQLEDSMDGTNWFPVASAAVTTAGNTALRVDTPFTDNLRVAWEILKSSPSQSGTATFAASLAAF